MTSISTRTSAIVIASSVPSIPSTAVARSASKPASPVTKLCSGSPSGPGSSDRSAATSRTIESVSSCALMTGASSMLTRASLENGDGPREGPRSCPTSPHPTPSGVPRPVSSGSAALSQIMPSRRPISACWASIEPVRAAKATTAVDLRPSGNRASSWSCTFVDSAERARNVLLSSAALCCSFGCRPPSATARTTQAAITAQGRAIAADVTRLNIRAEPPERRGAPGWCTGSRSRRRRRERERQGLAVAAGAQ